ncbi:hypothetical protein LOAG_13116, partial [Loa loa]
GLTIFILLTLASVQWVPLNSILCLIALATLSGSIISQLAYYLPSLLTIPMNYQYIYDLVMTICTAICVPLSTYSSIYQINDDNSSTLYIIQALLYIFLATSFMFCVMIQYDFYPFNRSTTSEPSTLTVRLDERYPLLQNYADYGNNQVF